MRAGKKAIFLLLSLALGGGATALPQGVDFHAIQPDGYKPSGLPFSQGILAGSTLYVSGQGPRDAKGNLPASFEDQVRQTLRNVRAVLQGAGMDYGNVTWMNIYVTNADDIDAMNRAYWQEIGSDPPARTVMVVGSLPAQGRVEINCIAVKSSERRRAIWPKGWRHEKDMDPPAIEAGDVLYLSGQDGADPKTNQIPSSFEEELRQALQNVSAITSAAGMSMKNVLWVNSYVTAGGQNDAMESVYKTFFNSGTAPARSDMRMAALPGGHSIVLSCIAGARLAERKVIRPRNMPANASVSPGILYGNTLYLSVRDGAIPGQGIVTPDLVLQLHQTMRNLLDGLEEANMTFSDVVFSRVYLRSIGDYDPMNNLYKTFLGPVPPTRTTLQPNNDSGAEAAVRLSFIAVRNRHSQPRDQ